MSACVWLCTFRDSSGIELKMALSALRNKFSRFISESLSATLRHATWLKLLLSTVSIYTLPRFENKQCCCHAIVASQHGESRLKKHEAWARLSRALWLWTASIVRTVSKAASLPPSPEDGNGSSFWNAILHDGQSPRPRDFGCHTQSSQPLYSVEFCFMQGSQAFRKLQSTTLAFHGTSLTTH
jgi:hypothetical protein